MGVIGLLSAELCTLFIYRGKQGVDIVKYLNATEVLPRDLLIQIQKHIKGEVLYIPSGDEHTAWGEKNGSRSFFENRNKQIEKQYENGHSLELIASKYGLAYDTVRKIIYKK